MKNIAEIEAALRQLPRQDTWEIARWLLDHLEGAAEGKGSTQHPTRSSAPPSAALPNYAARRRRIFGDKVLPNLVLSAREEERW